MEIIWIISQFNYLLLKKILHSEYERNLQWQSIVSTLIAFVSTFLFSKKLHTHYLNHMIML